MSGYTQSGSGKSMSRLLAAFFVGCIGISLVVVAWQSKVISGPWATAAVGVTASILSVWGLSKVRSGKTPPPPGGQP